ncbi:MAG: radical SAM protein [Methanobrevibacter sp.]|jgi:MoaA/NifB/PqqE/SkfB family radical SAM enzyme|nr:radical SAM protein [Methanobrevibacter sp.]
MNVNNYIYLDNKYSIHKCKNGNYICEKDEYKFNINNDFVNIFELCTGNRTILEVINIWCEKYNENFDEVYDQFENILLQTPFIKISEEPGKISTLITGSFDKQYPVMVSVDLTNKCNFKCKHCYNESVIENDEFIETGILFKFLDYLSINGCRQIAFTGGEPLLHKDINDIIDYACKRFIFVRLITNGSLLKKHIPVFAKYHNLIIRVSMHSFDEEYYDWFIGVKGYHKIVLDNLADIVKYNIEHDINVVMSPKNFSHIEQTAEMLHEVGVRNIRFGGIDELGRANQDLLLYNESNTQQINNCIDRIADKYEENFILKYPEEYKNKVDRVNCGCGFQSIALMYDGTIRVCTSCDHGTAIANIYNTDYDEIFTFIGDEEYNLLQEPCNNICGDCVEFDICRYCLAIPLNKYIKNNKECKWTNYNHDKLSSFGI